MYLMFKVYRILLA